MRSLVLTSLVGCAALVGVTPRAQTEPTPGAVAPRDLAAWLPAETVLLIEGEDLRGAVAALYEFLAPLPPRAQATAVALQALLFARLGGDLHTVLAALAPGPIALAVVLPQQRPPIPILLARIADQAAAGALVQRLPGVGVALHDGVCAILPQPSGVAPFETFVRSDRPRLADRPGFRAGQPSLDGGALRLWIDIAALRARADRTLFGRLDPGGRVLIGPIAAALDAATRFDATLHLGSSLRIEGRVDASVLQTEPPAHLLARRAKGRPPLAVPDDTLLVLSLDRSVKNYLQHADALLPPAAAARVRGEAANLDAIVGGASFVDDLLSGIAEPMTLLAVAAPPPLRADDDALLPRVDLPGLALVAAVDTERAERLLTRAFYRLSAVLSAQRAQQRLPPRIAQPMRAGDLRLHVMRGMPFPGVGEPPTAEQIEATLVFAHGHAVLASTPECARQVAAALATARVESLPPLIGDALHLRVAPIVDYLRRNQSALTLARVLDEGESTRAATDFVENLCAGLLLVHDADVHIEPQAGQTRFSLTLGGRRR